MAKSTESFSFPAQHPGSFGNSLQFCFSDHDDDHARGGDRGGGALREAGAVGGGRDGVGNHSYGGIRCIVDGGSVVVTSGVTLVQRSGDEEQ